MGRQRGPHGAGGPAASGSALHDVVAREGQVGNCADVHVRRDIGIIRKGIRSSKSILVGGPSGAGGRHEDD